MKVNLYNIIVAKRNVSTTPRPSCGGPKKIHLEKVFSYAQLSAPSTHYVELHLSRKQGEAVRRLMLSLGDTALTRISGDMAHFRRHGAEVRDVADAPDTLSH